MTQSAASSLLLTAVAAAAPLLSSAPVPLRRERGRGGKLLPRFGQLRLQIRKLLPRSLQTPLDFSDLLASGGEIVGGPSKLTLQLRLPPLELVTLRREAVAGAREGCDGLLDQRPLLMEPLALGARGRHFGLGRGLRLAGLLQEALRIGELGRFGAGLLRDAREIIPELRFLLAGLFQTPAHLRQFPSARRDALLTCRDLGPDGGQTLLGLVHLPLQLTQALRGGIGIPDRLGHALLSGLQGLLDGCDLRLSLVPRAAGLAHRLFGRRDPGLQISKRAGGSALGLQLAAEARLRGLKLRDLVTRLTVLLRQAHEHDQEKDPADERQASQREADWAPQLGTKVDRHGSMLH